MYNIGDFLSKYIRFTPPDMVVRKKLSKIISQETNKTISESDIRIIGPIAYCTFDSMFKNIVFMKKNTILQQLTQELGKSTIRDIQ